MQVFQRDVLRFEQSYLRTTTKRVGCQCQHHSTMRLIPSSKTLDKRGSLAGGISKIHVLEDRVTHISRLFAVWLHSMHEEIVEYGRRLAHSISIHIPLS